MIWIRNVIKLGEGETSFGTLGFYAVEFLIIAAFLIRGRPILPPGLHKVIRALFLFFAAIFLSLTFSRLYFLSVFTSFHLVVAGLLFVFLCDERTPIHRIVKTFIFGLILPCILGWFQHLNGFSAASTLLGLAEKHVETKGIAVVATDTFRSLRAYGSFPHPNIFGGYLAIGISLIFLSSRACRLSPPPSQGGGRGVVVSDSEISRLVPNPLPLTPYLSSLTLILLTSTLLLTFSRSAWLATIVGLIAILLMTKSDPKEKTNLKSFVIFFASIAVMSLFLHNHIAARFNPTLPVEATSITERTSQYQSFTNVFKINPLTGTGSGTYVFALESTSKGNPSWSYQPIHNTFLLILAEIGILGFLSFSYLIFQIFVYISPSFTRRGSGGGRMLSMPSIFLLQLLPIALLDHYLFSLWPGIILSAFVLAIIIRFSNENNEMLDPMI